MRLKVGDRWFAYSAEHPIMVEFSEQDKANLGITRMAPGATRYAEFHPFDQRTVEERGAWMDEGARSLGGDVKPC